MELVPDIGLVALDPDIGLVELGQLGLALVVIGPSFDQEAFAQEAFAQAEFAQAEFDLAWQFDLNSPALV